MGKLVINQDKIVDLEELIKICPFGAMEAKDGKLDINSGCKMCKLCVKKSGGAIEYVEEEIVGIDKENWIGIAVYADHIEGEIHPVTYELIGKARELSSRIKCPVYAVFAGCNIEDKAEELLHYGVDEVFVYDSEELRHFRIEPYTAAIEDFIKNKKPSIMLVGATTIGRSLAPRVAARFRTGLTADCTVLDVRENTDLIQIRPAFGGNIMAQILNPNNRPQLATVRYKVMTAPERSEEVSGEITVCRIEKDKLKSGIEVLKVMKKEKETSISDAEVIIAVGRGLKSQADMKMIIDLADILNASIAVTRPLIEAGWGDAKMQIGLSGRTVKPKLIVCCGISGSVQFAAGMNNSDCIIAINKDEKAPIFNIAHIGIVGDMYKIIPELIKNIKSGRGISA